MIFILIANVYNAMSYRNVNILKDDLDNVSVNKTHPAVAISLNLLCAIESCPHSRYPKFLM